MIGDLTYEFDKVGTRSKIGGSWATTGMPEPITTTSYDVNNRQLTFGDKATSNRSPIREKLDQIV